MFNSNVHFRKLIFIPQPALPPIFIAISVILISSPALFETMASLKFKILVCVLRGTHKVSGLQLYYFLFFSNIEQTSVKLLRKKKTVLYSHICQFSNFFSILLTSLLQSFPNRHFQLHNEVSSLALKKIKRIECCNNEQRNTKEML